MHLLIFYTTIFFFWRSQLPAAAPRPVFFVVISYIYIEEQIFFVAPTLVYFWSRCLASSRKAGIAFFVGMYVIYVCK